MLLLSCPAPKILLLQPSPLLVSEEPNMSRNKEVSSGGNINKYFIFLYILSIKIRIKKYPGETESLLRCEITLTPTNSDKAWVKPPITMEFQVHEIKKSLILYWLIGSYVYCFGFES